MLQRLVSPVVIKLAVAILLIKELWLLMGIPAFTDAIVSFLTVGAIPGTNKSLTPDEIYRLLVGVFVLSVLLIFRKDIGRFIARRRRSPEAVEDGAVTDISPSIQPMPLEHPLAKLGVGLPDKQDSREGLAGRRIFVWAEPKIAFGRQTLGLAAAKTALIAGYLVPRALVLAKRMKIVANKAMWASYQAAMQFRSAAAEFVAGVLRTLEPYARRFDFWLDRKLHQYELTTTILTIGNEMLTTARKMASDMKQSYQQAKENALKSRQDIE